MTALSAGDRAQLVAVLPDLAARGVLPEATRAWVDAHREGEGLSARVLDRLVPWWRRPEPAGLDGLVAAEAAAVAARYGLTASQAGHVARVVGHVRRGGHLAVVPAPTRGWVRQQRYLAVHGTGSRAVGALDEVVPGWRAPQSTKAVAQYSVTVPMAGMLVRLVEHLVAGGSLTDAPVEVRDWVVDRRSLLTAIEMTTAVEVLLDRALPGWRVPTYSPRRRWLGHEVRARVVALDEQGATAAEIAEEVGRSLTQVRVLLRRARSTYRPPAPTGVGRNPARRGTRVGARDQERLDQVVALVREHGHVGAIPPGPARHWLVRLRNRRRRAGYPDSPVYAAVDQVAPGWMDLPALGPGPLYGEAMSREELASWNVMGVTPAALTILCDITRQAVYARLKKIGQDHPWTTQAPGEWVSTPALACRAPGCDQPVHRDRLCREHHEAWLRCQDPSPQPMTGVEMASWRASSVAVSAIARIAGVTVNPVYRSTTKRAHLWTGQAPGTWATSTRRGVRTCEVPGCDARHLAGGLCQKHYTRRREGRPLHDELPEVGSPSGVGRYGILDDDGDTVMCHECGYRSSALGSHVYTCHGLRARDYKVRHGLPLTQSLTSTSFHQTASETARARIGTPAWQRLEQARDPEAAARARDETALRSPAGHRAREQTAPANAVRSRPHSRWCADCHEVLLTRTPGGNLATLCPACVRARSAEAARGGKDLTRDARIIARHLAGEPQTQIARDIGMTGVRVGQIVRWARPGGHPDGHTLYDADDLAHELAKHDLPEDVISAYITPHHRRLNRPAAMHLVY